MNLWSFQPYVAHSSPLRVDLLSSLQSKKDLGSGCEVLPLIMPLCTGTPSLNLSFSTFLYGLLPDMGEIMNLEAFSEALCKMCI